MRTKGELTEDKVRPRPVFSDGRKIKTSPGLVRFRAGRLIPVEEIHSSVTQTSDNTYLRGLLVECATTSSDLSETAHISPTLGHNV
jgi:hypothetical protein